MRLNVNAIEMALARQMMTLKELAKKSDVSYMTVLRATRQDVDFGYKTIGKLARGLGVPVESIVCTAE